MFCDGDPPYSRLAGADGPTLRALDPRGTAHLSGPMDIFDLSRNSRGVP
jgi:hypothetical protein